MVQEKKVPTKADIREMLAVCELYDTSFESRIQGLRDFKEGYGEALDAETIAYIDEEIASFERAISSAL